MTNGKHDTQRLRLLLVAAGKSVRRAVGTALRAASIEADISVETDAAGALARLSETAFDVALLDVDVAGDVAGEEGLRILRQARGASAGTPIVVLTGHGDEETAVTLLKAGAADYLPKSGLSAEKLVLSLRHAQRVHGAERRAAEAAAALERHLDQWRALADAAVEIHSAEALPDLLGALADRARHVLRADRSAVETRLDGVPADAASAISLSDRYAEQRSLILPADPYGIGEKVKRTNRPVRLTADEVLALATAPERDPDQSDPDSGPAESEADDLPPPLGWLAAPLLGRSGTCIGALHVADRRAEFDAQDEAMLVHLAQVGAVAVENLRLIENARQAARATEQVLAVVSHDLRNPLNTVNMAAALLLETPLPQAQVERQLAAIKRAAVSMNRMIQDLLDVSRMEAGLLSIEPAPLPAARLVQDAAELLGPIAAEQGLQLQLAPAPADLIVEADRDRVIQVLSNLVGNAVKFTPSGGTISVAVERYDGEARFAVRDTGSGMDAAALSRIFEPFWQAAKRLHSGAGLGLPIAKGIVEAHGGRLWAISEPGDGSTFYFTVPTAGGS